MTIKASELDEGEAMAFAVEIGETGLFVPAPNWIDFARRWAELRRQLRKPVHYCRLAVALRSADGERLSWGEYIDQAAILLATLEDDELVNRLTCK